MKKLFIYLILLTIFAFTGCQFGNKSNENIPNIEGMWESYRIFDNDTNATDYNISYFLILEQNRSNLKGSLKIDKDNNTSIIDMTGSLDGAEFYLKDDKNTTEIFGLWESNETMQMSVLKNPDSNETNKSKIYHALLKRFEIKAYPNTNNYELKRHCYSSSGKNIVLIHGFNSNANIWGKMIWNLKHKGFCNKYSVWTYQYDWKRGIELNAIDMIARINRFIDNPPIIIAHSMGGLVARSYIAQYGYYSRLITLGTPHEGGSALLNVFHWNFDGLKDMAPNSNFLKELNKNNYEMKQRHNYLLMSGEIKLDRKCSNLSHTFCWWYLSCSWHGCSRKRACKTVTCKCCRWYWSWSGNYSQYIKEGYFTFWIFNQTIPNDGVTSVDSALFKHDKNVKRGKIFYWLSNSQLPNNNNVIKTIMNQL